MKLADLKDALSSHPTSQIKFKLPNGEFVASHAHVTEVARIDKKFIDCGGTFRNETYCRLQTWVADDFNHRLIARKLLGILEKAKSILLADDLSVDVEHEVQFISQFPIDRIDLVESELIIALAIRHTECLAPEKCCLPGLDLVSLGHKSR